jgi:23S rRNA pseudouridine1911/1915/1917 synthase
VISKVIDSVSRARIQKVIRDGHTRLNSGLVRPSVAVRAGDIVDYSIPDREEPKIRAQDIPLDIIYQDGAILVINKPPGLVVHPGAGNPDGTVANALLHLLNKSDVPGETLRPGIVHRLDKETSGLLVVAKTDRAVRSLARQIAEKIARRIYRAVVWGKIPRKEGTIEAPIGRNPVDRKKMAVTPFNSKPAITHFRVLEEFNELASYLEIELETGRTHQIRVHMEYYGHPVIGDPTYSGRDPRKIFRVVPSRYREHVQKILQIMKRQALHAKKLVFRHPKNDIWMEIESDLPEDMKELLQYLRTSISQDQ